MLKTEQQLESYYNSIIKNFIDEHEITHFLNKPEIFKKHDDEDRDWLILRWLDDNGWVEVENEDLEENTEVMEYDINWPFPTTKPEDTE